MKTTRNSTWKPVAMLTALILMVSALMLLANRETGARPAAPHSPDLPTTAASASPSLPETSEDVERDRDAAAEPKALTRDSDPLDRARRI